MWNSNSDTLFNAMIARSNKTPLEKTIHFLELNKLINYCEPYNSLVDIGCGVGELGRVYKNKKYLGIDLPNIIENVAKIKNPNQNYIHFDANNEQIPNEIKIYDVVIMNSFISELLNPMSFLKNLFLYKNKYIIIHRQDFTNKDTYLQEYNSYANLKSTNCHINKNEFFKMIESLNYRVLKNVSAGVEKKESVLIKIKT